MPAPGPRRWSARPAPRPPRWSRTPSVGTPRPSAPWRASGPASSARSRSYAPSSASTARASGPIWSRSCVTSTAAAPPSPPWRTGRRSTPAHDLRPAASGSRPNTPPPRPPDPVSGGRGYSADVILAAGLLVLLGLGLFIAGLATGTTVLYWATVGVCALAAVLL